MPIPKRRFDATAQGPLRGVRVLDFSRLVAGNMLSLQLADLGAEVVKVEAPGRGDTLRDWREKGLSVHWKVYARNKKSITLDLKSPDAPAIILDLVSHFDVMIESFRYRYLEKLGLGPDRLLDRNPKLVLVRVSGFGQTGPYAKRPGFGTLVEAMWGFASRNGFEDREPVLPPLAMADMIAGLYGAMAVVIAVRDVEINGGRGQVIDLSLLDSIFSILGPEAAIHRLSGKIRRRVGSASESSSPIPTCRSAGSSWRRPTTRWARCPCTRWCPVSIAPPGGCGRQRRSSASTPTRSSPASAIPPNVSPSSAVAASSDDLAGFRNTRRLIKKVQMRGGARPPHARRTSCTLSVRPRAPTKQMDLFHQPAMRGTPGSHAGPEARRPRPPKTRAHPEEHACRRRRARWRGRGGSRR